MPRKNDDDNPGFQLRPRKPPIPLERRSSPGLYVAFRAIVPPARSGHSYLQHCSVRVTHAPNRVTGHVAEPVD